MTRFGSYSLLFSFLFFGHMLVGDVWVSNYGRVCSVNVLGFGSSKVKIIVK